MEFSELGLGQDLLKAIADSGYTTPTPIQAQAIPHALAGKDVLGIAQTGTGKTASFTLPMIERLSQGRAKARMPRSLILEPTRELAAQVSESFERYGKHHKLSMALLIGGVSFEDQERKLNRGVDVLIATPGRLLDHVGRGKVMLTGVQTFVVDEADRMLDMGFIPDVERIFKLLPFTRQTLFFSATMPPEIQRLVDQFLHAPVRIEVARPASTAETIVQARVTVSNEDKREALRTLIRGQTIQNAIIFCNRKRDVAVVHGSLKKHGFSVGCLHGDMDQSARIKMLDSFKTNKIQLLVASDVAARGLDIPAVSHIFNFDVPHHSDDYVHRIGRTGRAGREGHAFMLTTPAESKNVAAIEKLIGKPIPEIPLDGFAKPEPRERGEKTASEPRRSRSRARKDPRDTGAPAKAAPAAKPAPEKPVREKAAREKPVREKAETRDRDPANAGFGDHMPGFMLRSAAR
ncbi:MAG: DEAD/DEAH box helicase [Alphaproteobacteria bacterium]|nr:DEAD/DEAH box helicase [Alphaproteobacteria bacterium]